jgi:hypothetical protein
MKNQAGLTLNFVGEGRDVINNVMAKASNVSEDQMKQIKGKSKTLREYM